jgi:multidrug resistance efflux pump
MALSLCPLAWFGCAGRDKNGSYPGFVDAPVSAVSAQVSGQVASVFVREGERVKRGQLLAQIDARERTALVAQAEANRERAREAIHQAERSADAIAPTERVAAAEVSRQQAELDDAAAEFERTQQLVQSNFATPSQLDAARARLEQARAAVASTGASHQAASKQILAALAAVRTARAQLAADGAALDLARVQLAQAEVRSPFDGLVVEQDLQVGEWAAPGTPVFAVEDMTRQWVRVDVEETALTALKVGDPAEVLVVAFPGRRYAGHVMEIGAEGEFALNRDVKRGRPDVRTFRVRIGLDRVATELRPGMTAEVIVQAAGVRP